MGSIIFESGTSTDKIIEMDKAIEIFNANGSETIKNIKTEGNTNIQDIKQDYDNLKKIVIDENNAANLQNQINSVDSQLSENVIGFGMKGDGVFDCSQLWSKVKSKNIYFPQNSEGNAVYYFSNTPNLDNFRIGCGKGVKLSFPTTNSISFKYTEFKNAIDIISRDRDNTGKQLKNDISELMRVSYTENDPSVGYKELKVVNDSKNIIYTANTSNLEEIAIQQENDGMYNIPSASIPNSTSKVLNLETDVELNTMFNADFEFLAQETDMTTTAGITISDGTNSNWIHWGIRPNAVGVSVGNINNSVKLFDARNYSSIFTDAYKMKYGFIFSYRIIEGNKCQVFLNGVYLETIIAPFEIRKAGFGCICLNQAGHGVKNIKIGRITKGKCEKINIGNTLRICTFGDSITFGEGAYSWAEYLPELIEGQRGITKATVFNRANSGNSTVQQLPVMRATNLAVYDIVCVLIGTNDIQFETSIETFTLNIREMINLAKKCGGKKVIFGIPPLWISQQLTQQGAFTTNYDRGSKYRSTIMYECAKANVLVADTMSEIGRIGVDNVRDVLRDNLHPLAYGQTFLARCFARSILQSIDQQ